MLLTVSSWTEEYSQGVVFFYLNGIEKTNLVSFFLNQIELI